MAVRGESELFTEVDRIINVDNGCKNLEIILKDNKSNKFYLIEATFQDEMGEWEIFDQDVPEVVKKEKVCYEWVKLQTLGTKGVENLWKALLVAKKLTIVQEQVKAK